MAQWREAREIAKGNNEIVDLFVSSLRNENGRLDARKVGKLFGLSLTDLSSILGRDKSAVIKTPDAKSLQGGLSVFERVASILLFAVDDQQQLRLWLNAPNKEFKGQSPMQVLKEGRGELLAQRLENALSGQPA